MADPKSVQNVQVLNHVVHKNRIDVYDEWVEVETIHGNQIVGRVGVSRASEDRLAFQVAEIAKQAGTSVFDVGIFLDRLKIHMKRPVVITGNIVRCLHTWEDFANQKRCTNCGDFQEKEE